MFPKRLTLSAITGKNIAIWIMTKDYLCDKKQVQEKKKSKGMKM